MSKTFSLFRARQNPTRRVSPEEKAPASANGHMELAGPHFVSSHSNSSPYPAGRTTDHTSTLSGILSACGITKTYRKAAVEIPVLKGVNLSVQAGEFLAIVGQSGSGKSTLLHLLGLLDRPDEGTISLEGQRIDNLPASARDQLRNRTFGMVFQFYHLLPELSTLENVMIPLMIGQSVWQYWRHRRENIRRAKEILELVGLSHRLKHRPRELSGGELQRAAIARALVNQPRILLADEPTGNLDPATGREILRLIQNLNRQVGLTIIMVTHDHTVAEMADRVVSLVDGRITHQDCPGA
ncbi:ABC transporter ATP-binding protein [Thermogutta sp.]|uniref:ABC transporter ATP-binding protein n=1 Tax=Thermogutta sp. TaxID=1962930 RepID=UPI003C7B0CD6